MSNVLNVNPSTIVQPTQTIRLVQPPVDKFKKLIDRFFSNQTELLEEIPSLQDDKLDGLRAQGEKLGAGAWILVAACDFEILKRVKAKTGRGNTDVQGVGIMSAIAKRAKTAGSSASTIRENAKIYKTFGETLTSTCNTLPDKGFYQQALKSNDPHKALNSFLIQKEQNPKFKYSQAVRQINEEKQGFVQNKAKLIDKHRSDEEKSLASHIQEFIEMVKKFRASCPDEDFAMRCYDPILEDFREFLDGEMDNRDARRSILEAWDLGNWKEDQISKFTGLSRSEVSHIMNQFENEGSFYKVKQGGKTEMASGMTAELWQKVGYENGNNVARNA